MRSLATFVALAAVFIGVACGGGRDARPSATEETAPLTSAIVDVSPPDGVACYAPLPRTEQVAFQGEVVKTEPGPGQGLEFTSTRVFVRLERVEAPPDAPTYEADYAPGEVLPVVLLGTDWPAFVRGDCVLGAGWVRRYACGAACDAAGFVAAVLFKALPTATP